MEEDVEIKKVVLEFWEKAPERGAVQNFEYSATFDTMPPIPAVGDTIQYELESRTVFRKIETRNFYYWGDGKSLVVTFTVADAPNDFMSKRVHGI